MPRRAPNSGSQRPSTQPIRTEGVNPNAWTTCATCPNRVLRRNYNPHVSLNPQWSMIWRLTNSIRPECIAEGGQEMPREDHQEQKTGQDSLTIVQQRYLTSDCPLSFLVMRLHANDQQEAPEKKKKGRPKGSKNIGKPLCERCTSLQSAQDGNITSQSTISDTTGAMPLSSTSDYLEDSSTPYSPPPTSSPYDNQGGYGSQCQQPPVNSQTSLTTPYLPPTFPSHDNQGGHQYPYQQGPVSPQVSNATPYLLSPSSPYYNGHQESLEQDYHSNISDPNIDPTLDTDDLASETPGSNDDAFSDTNFASDPSTEAQNQSSTQASPEQDGYHIFFEPDRDPTPDIEFADNYQAPEFPGSNNDASYGMDSGIDLSMAPEYPGSNNDASYGMDSGINLSTVDQFCGTMTVGVFDGDNNNISGSSSDLAPNLNTEAQNPTPEPKSLVQKGFDITWKSMEDPNRLCAAIQRIQREQRSYPTSPSYGHDGDGHPTSERIPHHRHRYSPYPRYP